ncbi:DUF4199 domain-containing protein [Flavobacterium sp. RSP49]|uniref:DUF4199 domain-containing protein n=1 Tax=unclassified Flavobacterium TaxID=196869 RepID=UPI000F83EC1B|nr:MULTISPECIES: DUF4199 domain-containing protein [unclassified Flavobacterium]RTY85896.1 DUF4199 domain-containing protein [Flavobacterium sp. RSP15]RTY99922.1 DUF4199 domain-containing protein [Flavobacterium sp. RSP49]
MINEIIKKNGVTYGVIAGVLLSLITAAMYAIDIKLFIAWWTTLLSLSVFIIVPIIMLSKTKKELNGILSFKEAFTTYFISAVVAVLISVVFKIILFNFIDPSVKETLLDLTIKYLISTSEQFGVPASSLNETVSKLRETDPYSIVEQLKGSVFVLFFCAILGLIMAAFFKSKTTQE